MCGLMGIIDTSGKPMSGEVPVRAMAVQCDRGNGLGAGFAGYGIYPDWADHYAFHIMYDNVAAREAGDLFMESTFTIDRSEPMPIRPTGSIGEAPILWRYFVTVDAGDLEQFGGSEEDYVVSAVMRINATIPGAFVASSGKNMGVFKGVGFAEEIAHFYRVDEYEGYLWTSHNRFPTNTPGWWGGAHPFALLDFSIVHNGELSSYGINERYVKQFGYECTMGTDTEVVAYLFDLMLRRHGLTMKDATAALAAPLWSDIDRMPEPAKTYFTNLRAIYGSAMLNGPFAIVLGTSNGMVAFNDRIKLRPLVAATEGTITMVASEESSIREVLLNPDRVWAPRAGEPVIATLASASTTDSDKTDSAREVA